ncbi:hypothetical protein LTR86_009428 [Recurvomyces mirabilis]|nr:hypothetical protein LTR86_009428 [Recurvomyces mirabilis]
MTAAKLAQADLVYVTEEKQRSIPWQYHGYPSLARHMASQHDFLVLRRFGSTQVRCMLHLQNRIGTLENALQAWDDFAIKQPPEEGDCGSMSHDPFTERTAIIQRLLPLLQQYNDLVISFGQIRQKSTAQKHHLDNLKNWFVSYPDSIVDSERHWEGKSSDLFPLVARPKTPLMMLLERIPWLRMRFWTKKRKNKDNDALTHYWSDTGLEIFTTVMQLAIGVGMLFAPVWWLNSVQDHEKQLAIITGFSVLFVIWCWAAAGNRPFEILAAFAAYMAVLMIYRQLGTSP